MDIKDLVTQAEDLTDYDFERKLNKLVRDNYRYKNLDENNRKVVMDLYKKYKRNLRKGIGISRLNVKSEMYRLYKNRIKLNLTDEDMKDIKEILEEFRS